MSTTTPTSPPATPRVAYQCPQCPMLVHLDLRSTIGPDGCEHLDSDRLIRALALHMRVGCGR